MLKTRPPPRELAALQARSLMLVKEMGPKELSNVLWGLAVRAYTPVFYPIANAYSSFDPTERAKACE